LWGKIIDAGEDGTFDVQKATQTPEASETTSNFPRKSSQDLVETRIEKFEMTIQHEATICRTAVAARRAGTWAKFHLCS